LVPGSSFLWHRLLRRTLQLKCIAEQGTESIPIAIGTTQQKFNSELKPGTKEYYSKRLLSTFLV